MSDYTIEAYLQGKTAFKVSDAVIAAVLFDRGVDAGTLASAVSVRVRELCWADILMAVAYGPAGGTGEYNSDGGWIHQEGTQTMSDADSLITLARSLYRKWGDAHGNGEAVGGITMKALY